jgi:serine/threonine protein kinase
MSLIGKSVGNYRVIAKIGEGGMGSVYLGEHPMIGKRVAIKTLHPDLATKEDIVSRFFTEARSVNDIGHPNIVDIVDFGKMRDEDNNSEMVYFVMEFLDGEGLNQRLKRDGVSPREAVHILRQCCSALAASHKKHVVHRDLKPENIYLIHRGDDLNYTKLLDFGIAKLTGGETSASHKTRTGLVIGTPAYMSPEQCEGKGNIDWRSDIYSLGVVFYEMLTGRVPFPGDGFGEVLVAHLTKEPELPSTIRQDVPAGLEAIVMHSIQKDREKRFQSMEEFIAALDDPGRHLAAYGSPSGRGDRSVAGTVQMSVAAPTPSGPARTPTPSGGTRIPTGQGPRVPTGESPRPTTLSGTSGEVDDGFPARRSRTPIFAALGILVVFGGGAGLFLKQRSARSESDRQAVEAAQQAAAARQAEAAVAAPQGDKPRLPESVRISVDSTPRGARVYRAGVGDAIGATPLPLSVKRNEPDFDVQVKMEGYRDETRTVSPARDQDLMVVMSRIEPVAPPVAPPAPTGRTTAAATTTTTTTTSRSATASSSKGHHHGSSGARPGKPSNSDDLVAPAF